jgi:uncharacterized protein YoaH (UPF0181 family)
MTQGIREFTNATFNATLPQLAELGNIAFRAEVMNQSIMAFGISVGSAATHYNHALKQARIANPEAVAKLGRPEDKKGGRKPVHLVDVIKVKTGEVVASGLSKAKAELLVTKAAATPNKPRLAIKAQEAAVEAAPAVETTAVATTEAATV